VVPAVITVLNTDDAGAGSLRDAITQADQDTAPDTITFAPRLTGTIALLSALPDLSRAITIDGPGPSALTVAGPGTTTPVFRIFTVPAGADVTISGLTIRGGFAPESGGGIYNDGTLTVTDSSISGSEAVQDGGGIYNDGTLTVTDSSISGSVAFRDGGAGLAHTSMLIR
jgi:hypothetical protein